MAIPLAELAPLFRRMLLIRKAEERLARDFKAGQLPGPVHLYIGQEAIAVGVCAHLRDGDRITSTHRGHGHFLAKGGDPKAMFAEVYGRATGICGGMGGSMHVADVGRGILGANGIVGGGIALAAGAALSAQLAEQGEVAVAFFGDGAANQGVVMETLNIAALWRLPLMFVCENNGYSEFSPTASVTAGAIADRATAFGVPRAVIDGNSLDDVWDKAGEAVLRARSGEGPTFIEARTYRFHGHVEGESAFLADKYRNDEEVENRRSLDPILRLRNRLIQDGVMSHSAIAAIDQEIESEIASIADACAQEPWPEAAVLANYALR